MMRLKKSIEDITIKSKKILMRVDFNVPLQDGAVRDDSRIRAALPTIRQLLESGACLVLASHLGRPSGVPDPALAMDPVAERLSFLLGRPVRKQDQVVGPEVEEAVERLREGEVMLLENLRFEKGEEANDPDFARALAAPFDLFVNDAFGTAHRAHASTAGVAAYIPAVAGLLMIKEIEELSRALENPSRPMVVILGGANVSDKINIIRRFINIADYLLIGGGMANTFLASFGYGLGGSLVEQSLVAEAGLMLQESRESSCEIVLPLDLVVTRELKPGSENLVRQPGEVTGDWKAVDMGPQTISAFKAPVSRSAMVVWNGPLGVFEVPPYDQGTAQVASAVADSDAYSIIGGGDLVAALEALGLSRQVSFISTGGGATLEFWEGKVLPGIAALQDKN